MRIAQVAPLHESVPPEALRRHRAGRSFLTEALVDQGHDVTLFASGDSKTRAKLVACAPEALRLDPRCVDPLAHHVRDAGRGVRARERLRRHPLPHRLRRTFPLARRHAVPHVTTLHGRLDIPDLAPLLDTFADVPVVSISDAQREPLPEANWRATVHHGLPPELYSFRPGAGDYLAFLGRISPEKRLDRAIEIARAAGHAAEDRRQGRPGGPGLLRDADQAAADHPLVEFVGEIGEAQKNDFLGNAAALLFPIDWPEPFGLVMIEAMACGTPVIAFRAARCPR